MDPSRPLYLYGLRCYGCREVGQFRLEFREEFVAAPVGDWYMAGQPVELPGTHVQWPYATCEACGKEERGRWAIQGAIIG